MDIEREMAEATMEAIELAGGPSTLARKIGRTRQTIHNWLAAGRIRAEEGDVLRVEEAIQARVTRYQLRPDVYGE